MKIKIANTINHGVVNVGDLPIPFDMVLNAAVIVVVITFVYLKISWKESIVISSRETFEETQNIIGKIFGVIILFFIIGMFLTPPDILSQIFLALPMWMLFELGILISKDKG